MYLGIDTSNYTTSAAAVSGDGGANVSQLLQVAPGALGLRQSDALFQHIKRLPDVLQSLFAQVEGAPLRAVAASTRPRAVEGSYMPCFLAGQCVARSIAESSGVPFYAVSHQQGHIAAVLWSAARLELLDRPFLAWHLSGGTTELLCVRPDQTLFTSERIGGTTDISAGQVIDRAGLLLELAFPCGKALDALAQQSDCAERFSVKLNELSFSFSGLENKAREFSTHHSAADTAAYVLNSVADAVRRTTENALKQYPGLPVVFTGGVASNSQLRRACAGFDAVFSAPQYATDNAMGVAVLCRLLEER